MMAHTVRMMHVLMRSFGYGVVLYACMYLAWALLSAYDIVGTGIARTVLLLVLLVSTLIAARSLRLYSARDILPFSVSWVVTIGVIDALFALPSGNWAVFADPNLWIGYLLVLTAPLVLPYGPRFAALPDIT